MRCATHCPAARLVAFFAKPIHSLEQRRAPGSRGWLTQKHDTPLPCGSQPGSLAIAVFINLYSPQAILPLLSEEFSAGAAEISTIITVSTLAVALTAPFTGTVADILGRKRVIVAAMFMLVIPSVMVGLSSSPTALNFGRAVQGLVLPPIFAVMVAYIGDELPRHEATTVAGIYSSGSSLGGFSGMLFTGLLADLISWRAGFMVLGAITFAGAVVV